MFIVYSTVLILSVVVSALLTPLCIYFSNKYGYLDNPSERKLHTRPVPYGGGVAIFSSLSVIIFILFICAKGGYFLPPELPSFIDLNVLLKDKRALSFLFGAVAIFILGFIDDIYDIPAKVKLFFQFVIISAVIHFSSMTLSFFIHIPLVAFLGTLFWIVLITNAFNLLDNMDGLCGGVSVVTLIIYFVLTITYQQNLVSLLTLIVSAPVLVFLYFNKPPARVYLGDAGSLLLGFLVAILSVMSTYYRESQHLSTYFTPLLILAIPLYDVTTVMLIRYKNKKPFFQADKNHFSHRLLNLGMTTTQVLMLIMSLCAVMGMGAILLIYSNEFQSAIIFSEVILLFLVIYILEKVALKRKLKDHH